jgi:hypothetical protein
VNILEISCYFHDAAASLIQDGVHAPFIYTLFRTDPSTGC